MDSKLERLRAEKELLAEENSLLEAGLSTVTTQHGKIEKSSVLSSVGSASSRKSSEGGIDTASGEEDRVTPPDQINHSDRWQIPSAMWCRRHGFTGRVDSDWVDRRLGIQDSKLVALYGKHGEQVCIVCDCRDTFLIDLRRPLGNATPPPRAQHTLTLYLKGGQTLLFAAPSAAILNQWVTATRKVSGASIQQQQRTDRVGLDEDDDSSSSSKGTSFSTTVLPASAPSSLGNYSVKIYWDGSKYAGEWKNGLWHGHGRLRTEMPHGESDVYEGGFSHGEKDGFGDMCYSSGDSYHGEFKMGKKHGKGTYLQYLRDGAAKEGERATLEQRLELRAFLGSAVDAYRKELQDRCHCHCQ